MSVSITEVVEQAGYDPTNNVDDANWLLSQASDFEDLITKAKELLDQYNCYQDFCEIMGSTTMKLPTFEEWREHETEE